MYRLVARRTKKAALVGRLFLHIVRTESGFAFFLLFFILIRSRSFLRSRSRFSHRCFFRRWCFFYSRSFFDGRSRFSHRCFFHCR